MKTALLSSRAILKVSGPDASSFLQGVITQDVDAVGDGRAIFAALLTPQGKILFDFFVAQDGEGFVIDCAAESADALAKRLSVYRLRAKVTIGRTDDAIAAVWGTLAPPTEKTGMTVFPDPRLEELGQRVVGPAVIVSEVTKDVGERLDETAYDDRRLSLGVPEFGKDFAANEMFLLDVNYDALNGVSYKKGCFIGQEVTSRMKRKGDIRKRTLVLSFDDGPLEKGASIIAGESPIGEVLYGNDKNALALIRVDRLKTARDSGVSIMVADTEVQISVPGWLKRD